MGLLVIAGGDIRFEQHPDRTEAGVFLTKKSLTADWAADMFVHAHGGARFRSQSVKILAYNTRVVADSPVDVATLSGKLVFSGFPAESAPQSALPRMVGEIEFVGQRCSNAVPLREIANRVPALALTKAHCKKINLLVARCGEKSGLAEGEELWTVHMCKNLLTDIRVRTINGRAQIEFYNPRAVPRPPRVDTTTTAK